MNNFFIYTENGIELNEPEILLVKEFAKLFSLAFNKGEVGDKDGRKRLKAFRVMTFIYLMYNWKSPYYEFSDRERFESALMDSDVSEDLVKHPDVQAAIAKYISLRETRLTKLMRSANIAVDKIRNYFETVDLNERDVETGKPIYSAKDVMSNLASLGKTVESLQQLELMIKREQAKEKGIRGGAESGMFDDGWE